MWTPLAIGAQLRLLPTYGERDFARSDAIAEQQVTIAQFVPSELRVLTQTAKARQRFCDFVLSGGEALDATLAAEARSACAPRARESLRSDRSYD